MIISFSQKGGGEMIRFETEKFEDKEVKVAKLNVTKEGTYAIHLLMTPVYAIIVLYIVGKFLGL